MVIAIFLLLATTVFFAFFEERLGHFKWYVYTLVGIGLIVLAAIRPVGIDNDSFVYEDYFVNYDNPINELAVEFSYRWLSKIFYASFKDVHSVFLLYAILGVTLKIIAFRRLTKLPFLALAIYICTYYILHEFTQIRVGISSGILLFIIMSLGEGKRLTAFALMLVAAVFHYSSIMLLPLLLLQNEDLTEREKRFWQMLVLAGYVLYFTHIELLSLPIPYIADKIETYKNMKEGGFLDEVHVFNLVYLVKIFIFFYIIEFYDVIKKESQYLPIMIKMESISLFSFTAFSSLPVLSFRISELFGIVEIILYVNIFYTIRPWWISKIVVSALGMVLLSIAIFYNKLVQIM